ncbi:MAG: dihydroorotate dehydrogenase electron transfer subunit [Brachymonas sp.]|nr:dihydroorotate dehydrogenase electron transfer subunit [Brachymonas sp.]
MQFAATVIFNTELSPGYWHMQVTAPKAVARAAPGQFVMVRVSPAIDPLLRRPLAILDAGLLPRDQAQPGAEAYFDMLYHVVGKGTAILAQTAVGSTVDILGPLGTGFDLGAPDEEKLLVGGGIGLAPLYLLAKELRLKQMPVHLFAGGRSREDVLFFDEFGQLGAQCHAATNDGSFGEEGFVTVPLLRHLDQLQGKPVTIFACGPEPMLRAVARLAIERNVACQVSLEGYMACGVGACLACVVPGENHSEATPDFRCVCTEGPVFDVRDLQWEAHA